jgi:hypothetical protein
MSRTIIQSTPLEPGLNETAFYDPINFTYPGAWPMPWTSAPWTWPSTISGLIMRPKSSGEVDKLDRAGLAIDFDLGDIGAGFGATPQFTRAGYVCGWLGPHTAISG